MRFRFAYDARQRFPDISTGAIVRKCPKCDGADRLATVDCIPGWAQLQTPDPDSGQVDWDGYTKPHWDAQHFDRDDQNNIVMICTECLATWPVIMED